MQDLLEIILQPLAEVFFLLVGYPLGCFLVMFGSLGSLEPGPIQYAQDYKFYRSKGMKWWHITYLDDGRRYLPAETVAAVAWIFLAAIAMLIGLLIYYAV